MAKRKGNRSTHSEQLSDRNEALKVFRQKPDYSSPSRLKKMITESFEFKADALDTIKGRGFTASYDCAGRARDRRKTALCEIMPKVKSEFECLYPDILSVEETFAHFETTPNGSFDISNEYDNLLLGAALWILDDLKRTARLNDAYQYMPTSFSEMECVDLPLEFNDPCFEHELIKSVMYVLQMKHSDYRGWNAKDNKVFVDQWIGQQKSSVAMDKCRSLIALLDPEKVKTACMKFEEKQWEFLCGYFKAANIFAVQQARIVKRLESSLKHVPNILLVKPVEIDREKQRAEELDLIVELEDIEDASRKLEYYAPYLASLDKDEAADLIGRADIVKMLTIEIEDPYELCFALWYLLDSDSKIPWLYNTSLGVINQAASFLPWHIERDDEWFDDEWRYNRNNWIEDQAKREKDRKLNSSLDFYSKRFENGTKNLAQILYELTGSVMPRNLHPFERERESFLARGMDTQETAKIIDLAELLFLSEYPGKALNLRGGISDTEWLMAWLGEDVSDKKIDEVTVSEAQGAQSGEKKVISGGYWGSIAKTKNKQLSKEISLNSSSSSETGYVSTTINPSLSENEELKDENAKLKEQLKKMREALYQANKSAEEEHVRYEQERRASLHERRELADLRELIFNREQEQTEKLTIKITYPYQTAHRIVCFGGHETFLKTIRPMLPGVKFIDADSLVNGDIVKNADVIWLQTNCMPHSQYYRVATLTRKYDIPLRYFAYSSAEKCAEQLVMEDHGHSI